MSRPLAVLTYAAVLSCSPMPDEAESASSRSSEIVGGTIANGDPAVVGLADATGYFCTGTLIGPLTVLTAGHCIGGTQRVLFGTQLSAPTSMVPVVQELRHPQYSDQTLSYDVGLLRLGAPVTAIAPIPLRPGAVVAGDVGRAIRHVGFGATSGAQTGGGTKREVSYTIREILPLQIESGATGRQTCNGDSGGPAFVRAEGSAQDQIIGVVSYGDEQCSTTGYDARVDVAAAWIQQAVVWEKLPACATDGFCIQGCGPVDVDCLCLADGACSATCPDLLRDPDCPRDCVANGVCATAACPAPDVDCVEVGRACQTETQCRDRACVSDPQHRDRYCTRPCNTALDCAPGMECAAGQCRFDQLPEVAVGQPCSEATFCLEGAVCAAAEGGEKRCAHRCSDTVACPGARETCETASDGTTRFCVAPELLDAPGSETMVTSACATAPGMTIPLGVLALSFARRGRRTLRR